MGHATTGGRELGVVVLYRVVESLGNEVGFSCVAFSFSEEGVSVGIHLLDRPLRGLGGMTV